MPPTSIHWISSLGRLLSASNELSAVSAGNAPAAPTASSLVHSHRHCALSRRMRGSLILGATPVWRTRRPVKLQRSLSACSLPAKLPSFHLDTVGILAGRCASPLSHRHGPHLDFGHSDHQQNPGYFTGSQPDGLNLHIGVSASACTAAARMAPDSGSHWNRD